MRDNKPRQSAVKIYSCSTLANWKGKTILLFLALFFALAGLVNNALSAAPELAINQVFIADSLFKSRITVFFTLVNPTSGATLTNLPGDSIRISEDGTIIDPEIILDTFASSGRELGYLAAMDASEDLTTSLTMIIRSINGFVDEMGFLYPGALLNYSGRPEIIIGPVRDKTLIKEAGRKITPIPGTPRLADALVHSVDYLEGFSKQLASTLDRLVLIVFTDGGNEGSRFSMQAAEQKILSSKVSLFVLGYGDRKNQNLVKLTDLSLKTGGEFIFNHSPLNMENSLIQIARRLKGQYVLSYSSSNIKADGKRHALGLNIETDGGSAAGEFKFVAPKSDNAVSTYRKEALILAVLLALLALMLLGINLRKR